MTCEHHGACVSAGCPEMALHPIGQGATKSFEVALPGQDIQEPRVRWLAAKALMQDLIAGAIPDSSLQDPGVGKQIEVVGRAAAEGQGVHPFAEESSCKQQILSGLRGSWRRDTKLAVNPSWWLASHSAG
jgi:hypothetical protein